MLPKDPAILFSYVNVKLRDYYNSLETMCDDLDVSRQELEKTLLAAGYLYDKEKNRFVGTDNDHSQDKK